MNADLINGLFETLGGLAIASSCLRLWREKRVQGIALTHMAFFTAWGFWNLYFYPAFGAWLSFYGGLGVVTVNAAYLGMLAYYRRFPGGRG